MSQSTTGGERGMLVVETASGQEMLSRARSLRLSLDELPDRLGVSSTVVDDVMCGRAEVDADLAGRLSATLGETAGYWLTLDEDDQDEGLVSAWLEAAGDFKAVALSALRARG